ncbi:MAG: ArsR/SmtB family transcription factor [Promethearchaeota archaeon]
MEVQQLPLFEKEKDSSNKILRINDFDQQREILKALSSKTRWKIIELLQRFRFSDERGLDISTLAKKLTQTEANISAQCKRLEEAGLININYKPGGHGVRKICMVDFDKIIFQFL